MSIKVDSIADCYASGERGVMLWTQQLRAKWLGPALKLLTTLGISPDHITLLSLFGGLAFVPLFFYSKPLALLALAIHAALDGIDGPLARYQGTASPKGSFTDTTCDQTVVTTTTVCLMLPAVRMLDVAAGGIFIFLYAVVVAFAMIRNALQIPYSWLIRPRFIFYIWIAIELYLLPGTIIYLVWTFNILLALKMLTGFVQIRRKM